MTVNRSRLYLLAILIACVGGLSACSLLKKALNEDTTPTSAATGFQAVPSKNRILLAWTNPTASDFAGVQVRRANNAFPALVTDGTLVYEGTLNFYFDSGLSENQQYFYSIFAKDSMGNWSTKLTASAKIDTRGPAIPSHFSAAKDGESSIKLTWENPTDIDFSGLQIQRSTTDYPRTANDGTTVFATLVIAGVPTSVSYTDTLVETGKTYFYSIFARDQLVNFSEKATATFFVPFGASSLDIDALKKIDGKVFSF